MTAIFTHQADSQIAMIVEETKMTMSNADNTAGSAKFQAFCTYVGWSCEPIATSIDRTPDFDIKAGDYNLKAEVKTFTRVAGGPESSFSDGSVCNPGSRVRSAIKKAGGQLIAAACPTMLVLYNGSGNRLHTEPYSIMTAMRGVDVFDVTIPDDPTKSPVIPADGRSGGGRMFRADANTSFSAIGVLKESDEDTLELQIFHNAFAKAPIDADRLRDDRITHFKLPDDAPNSYSSSWIKF